MIQFLFKSLITKRNIYEPVQLNLTSKYLCRTVYR